MMIEALPERSPLMSEQVSSKGSTDELREMRDELFEQIAALAIASDKDKAHPLIRRLRQ
jgi:hypothetical protein